MLILGLLEWITIVLACYAGMDLDITGIVAWAERTVAKYGQK